VSRRSDLKLTRIVSRAPGKLVVLGEYAVLNGAPAMVLAVNRYCYAEINPSKDDYCRLIVRTTQDQTVKFEQGMPSGFEIVDTILRFFPGPRTYSAELDTSELFKDGIKIGLGSSAAVVTAWAGAWMAFSGQDLVAADRKTLRTFVGLHRAMQGGAGSGVDVSASLYGGVTHFQLDDCAEPHASALQLPKGVVFAGVFTGSAATTSDYLKRYKQWQVEAPGEAEIQQRVMVEISKNGISAADTNDADGFLEAIVEYGRALEMLGTKMGAKIFTQEHCHVKRTAELLGVSYKMSGAGGGDVGLAFSSDLDALEEFKKRVDKEYCVLELEIDTNGLHVEIDA